MEGSRVVVKDQLSGGGAAGVPADDLPEQQASVEAVGQAEDFLLVARAAFKLGKFGIARSLAILGLEESAKAFAYRTVALGAGWFKGSPLAEPDSKGAQELAVTERDLNRLHPEKHALDAGMELMLNILEGIGPLIAGVKAEGELDPGLSRGFAEQIVGQVIDGIETTDKLNSWKNNGFYVARSGSKIWTPRSVTADEAATVIARLEKRIAFVGPLVRFKDNAADVEAVARAMFGTSADTLFQDSSGSSDNDPMSKA